MNIDDFDFCGFNDFSRIIQINTKAEAKKIGKFMHYPDLLDWFNDNGPGKYYIRLTEGWDRGGRYAVKDIVFIPEKALTFAETMAKLKELSDERDAQREPFCIGSDLHSDHRENGTSYEEALAKLTPEQREIYDRMDLDKMHAAEAKLANFLNGHD